MAYANENCSPTHTPKPKEVDQTTTTTTTTKKKERKEMKENLIESTVLRLILFHNIAEVNCPFPSEGASLLMPRQANRLNEQPLL